MSADLFNAGLSMSAVISDCGLYPYRLGRTWDDSLRPAVFVMLNPSTATADLDDPTIRRRVGFARAWGCGGIDVVNLFAFRATDPDDMARAADPIGPDNDAHIRSAAEQGFKTVVAWGGGVPTKYSRRILSVVGILTQVGLPVWCLGTTKHGQPRHPLFVRGDAQLVPFRSGA